MSSAAAYVRDTRSRKLLFVSFYTKLTEIFSYFLDISISIKEHSAQPVEEYISSFKIFSLHLVFHM